MGEGRTRNPAAPEALPIDGELIEAREQLAATREILRAISRSPANVQPVFDMIAESAARLCHAQFCHVFRFDGELIHFAAEHGLSPEGAAAIRRAYPVRPGRASAAARAILSGNVEHIPDVLDDPDYGHGEFAKVMAFRSIVAVPMLRDGRVLGAVATARPEPGPFPQRQVELLRTFAEQAVIAIENVRLFEEVEARNREVTEALQQQTATAAVLKTISGSAFDLDAVLQTLVKSAAELCHAPACHIFLRDGDLFRPVQQVGWTQEFHEYMQQHPIRPGRGTVSGRAALTATVVHVPDVLADPEYELAEGQKIGNFRTVLGVPLVRNGGVIGVFILSRPLVEPFNEREIELVKTFSDQAVIAIENVRLFNEVEARNREVTEALEQQVATSAILRAIAASPTNIEPVLKTVAESAAQLCDAYDAVLLLRRGEALAVAAHHGPIPVDFPELPIGRGVVSGRSVLDCAPVHVHDLKAAKDDFPQGYDYATRLDFRTILSTPLLRENEAIGALLIRRSEVRPFSDKQIELLKTFADQAVIAIENVRLFDEVQLRNREVTEALEQQTATSEILRVISMSPNDVQPAFETIVRNAVALCGSLFANAFRFDGGLLHFVASHNVVPGYVDLLKAKYPMAPDPSQVSGRVVLTKSVVRLEDALLDSDYDQRFATAMSWRRMLGVPMLRDGEPQGVIVVAWAEAGPIPKVQEELLTTFADQAAIAIENTRLLSELRESLQQQTATSDVLKVISRSAFDLQIVLDTLAESAVRLCRADKGGIVRSLDGAMRYVATSGYSSGAREHLFSDTLAAGRGSAVGRVVEGRGIVHIADVREDPEYTMGRMAQVGEFRSVLAVPLLRDGDMMGVFALTRTEMLPFAEKEIELVQTFADQAVIAIENVRLFEEVQARTRELEARTRELTEALQQQTATAEVLKAISRSAFDLKVVLQTLVESATRLCDAEKGTITRQIDGAFGRAESYGFSEAFMEQVGKVPVVPERGTLIGRALLEGKVVHIPDVEADPHYTFAEAKRLGGFRTILGVPMPREGVPLGVLAVTRSEVRPFTERQIELVSTFADQAAIAIENARLFEEVQARTEELSRSLNDLRTAQDRLVQTEKLASLGQLTAGIAHEIKNPLNFVNNFSALSTELIDELQDILAGLGVAAEKRVEIDELAGLLRGNLEKVVQHGKRADSIVKNMLLHSRAGSGEHRPADINAIVEESLNLAYHGARAEKRGFNITMHKSLDPEAGEIDLYPQEITRVLLNLISNGFYAATKREESMDGAAYEPMLTASTKSLGDSVEIRIRDNGTGIPPEVKEKLFSPFFTTKPAGEGTGLGLSLSHDIVVKQHAGTIEVETESGAFTEFRIVLPRGAASLGRSGGQT